MQQLITSLYEPQKATIPAAMRIITKPIQEIMQTIFQFLAATEAHLALS